MKRRDIRGGWLWLWVAVALAGEAFGRPVVKVAETAPGVYEIAVRPGRGAGNKTVALRRGGELFWEGVFEDVDGFGRAGVPGLAVRWRARSDEALYGLGERFDRLDVAGSRVEMWIRDEPGQGDGATSYFCTPVLYSSAGYGLFAGDNPEGVFDLDSGRDGWNRYERAGREMTLWVVAGTNLRELVAKRAEVAGGLRGVPDWAWAPWISRNSYENQGEAEEAIEGMVARGIPVGAIVQEAWKGTSEKGEFNAFANHGWPDVDGFLARCEELGIRNVLWQVPILHPSSPHFREAEFFGYFVKNTAGEVRLREHWLAGFGNVDFTHPGAVAFWKNLQRPLLRKKSIAGFKADDGEDIQADDVFFDGRRGWEMHNEYSQLYAQALTELMDEEGVEGLLWSRSGSLGIERAPGLWAGDQYATWGQMASLIPAGLSSSLSGMPFWGHDIGGYVGDPGAELFVRWAQFGALSPFMQIHGMQPREPWVYGERVAGIYKKLAHVRMNLRPTLAALGREAARTGLPLMRPMAMEFPGEPRFAREQTQYMLGPDVLVAPVLEPGAGRRVAFPEGVWQHVLHPVSFEGPAELEVSIAEESVPAFVREGAALSVELDEGAELGTWREGAPVRALSFGPERALLRRMAAPHSASVLEGRAEVSFEADEEIAGRLVVETRLEGVAGWTERRVEAGSGRYGVDLAMDGRRSRPGEIQRYRIGLRGAGGEAARTLFEGGLRWESPVAMDAAFDGSGYAREGRRLVRTTLRNASGRSATVRVRADVDGEMAVLPADQQCRLDAGGEQTLEWMLYMHPRDDVGDRRVRFEATAGAAWLGEAEVAYARPWRWIVAGPFSTPPRTGHRIPLAPEWTIRPDVLFETREGPARWWALDAEHAVRNDGIDFTEAFGEREHAVGYALTKIASDREQDVELRMGSDDTLAVWVNGRRVHDAEVYRGAVPGEDVVSVRFVRGTNVVMAKVAQDVGGWKMHFWATAPGGGQATGLRDGFGDHGEYDPQRPAAERIERMAAPAAWKIAGPFPAGLLEGRLESVGPDALEGLDWRTAAAAPAVDAAIDLAGMLGGRETADAFAMLDLDAARAMPVELRCGSDDGMTLWLNGRKLLDEGKPRGFAPGENKVRAGLAVGRNRIVCRIRQNGGAWRFRVEVWDISEFPPRPLAR